MMYIKYFTNVYLSGTVMHVNDSVLCTYVVYWPLEDCKWAERLDVTYISIRVPPVFLVADASNWKDGETKKQVDTCAVCSR